MGIMRLLALGAAVIVAATPVSAATARRASPPPPRVVRLIYPTPAQLLRLWEQEPVVGAEIVALHRMFPDEVLRIAQTAIAKAKSGVSDADVSAYVFKARQDLMRDNLWFAGLAPDDKVKAYIDRQADLLQRLEKTDVPACAAVASGGRRYGASAAGLIAENVGQIGLMEAGRATPVKRETPTREDVSAMMTAIRSHGVTEAEAAALTSNRLGELAQDRLCHLGVATALAYQEIPLASAARVLALSKSPRDPRPASETPEQRVAAQWRQDPTLGSIMPALIAQMPDDMNAIIRAMADRARAGDPVGESAAFTDGFDRLIASHMDAIAAAPEDRIFNVGQATADYLEALQSVDPHCGLDKPPASVASTALDLASKRLTRAMGEALLAGRAVQANGQLSLARTRTPADRKVMLDRLRSLTGGGALYDALLNGKTETLPMADRCQVNRLMVQAMLTVRQPAQGDLLIGYLKDVYHP